MKAIIIVGMSLFIAQGCGTLERVTSEAVGEAVYGVMGKSAPPPTKRVSYSVGKEKISTVQAVRSSRNMGNIAISKTEKNPKGQTMVAIDNCKHPRVGPIRCGGYLYEVSSEGWLIKKPITFNDLNKPVITLAAGTYYLKMNNWDSGRNYYVTGEFSIKPYVTNYVSLELE
jgi:hypothetical protein